MGSYSSGTCNNNFWDTETSGQTRNSVGGATGKTTAEMKTVGTFTDETTIGLTTAWDFEKNPNDDIVDDNFWDIDNKNQSQNSGYPYFSWENGNTVTIDFTPLGSGTSNDPYLIYELYELQWVSENTEAWINIFHKPEILMRLQLPHGIQEKDLSLSEIPIPHLLVLMMDRIIVLIIFS